jgi:hypothetical protein
VRPSTLRARERATARLSQRGQTRTARGLLMDLDASTETTLLYNMAAIH